MQNIRVFILFSFFSLCLSLNPQCGISYELTIPTKTRIVGGYIARENEQPWIG